MSSTVLLRTPTSCSTCEAGSLQESRTCHLGAVVSYRCCSTGRTESRTTKGSSRTAGGGIGDATDGQASEKGSLHCNSDGLGKACSSDNADGWRFTAAATPGATLLPEGIKDLLGACGSDAGAGNGLTDAGPTCKSVNG
mmetsp:Transcript_63740/g.154136  ORF Transcript_63740/g.154136 Transcript_63740/m.154136 type:complete len:139 (+) Transcript_63740:361-777(+)